MSWSWRYYGDKHAVVAPALESESATQVFTSQSDAESWLGEFWRDLRDAGVNDVELSENDKARYTMSLAEAEG